MHSRNKTTVSPYYDESVRLGTEFQEGNKSWAGYDVVKYQNKIKDLVDLYSAKTILDYGCGKGSQYIEPLPYAGEDNWQTFDQFLGVTVYKYDPCVLEHSTLPPVGAKFDGVICTQVLNSIPDDDLGWVAKELESYADKFCFVGLNFQRPAKGKKPCTILHTFDSQEQESSSAVILPTGQVVTCSGGGKIVRTMRHGPTTN